MTHCAACYKLPEQCTCKTGPQREITARAKGSVYWVRTRGSLSYDHQAADSGCTHVRKLPQHGDS